MTKNTIFPMKIRWLSYLAFILSGAGFGLLFDQKALAVSSFPAIILLLLPFFLIRPDSGTVAITEGILFGVTANFIGIRWLMGTMVDYGHLPWALAIFGLILFSAYLSLFPAFFRYAMYRMNAWKVLNGRHVLSPAALFLGPTLWIISEAGKTEILSGFPWNPLGSLLFGHEYFVLPAKVVGTTGLSFFIILVTALTGISVNRLIETLKNRETPRVFVGWSLLSALALSGWPLWGHLLAKNDLNEPHIYLQIALVQGNIPPDQKWTADHLRGDLETYRALTHTEILGGAKLIVWPETALPVFYNSPLPFVTEELADLLIPGTSLITGSIGETPSRDSSMGVSFTNAAVQFGAGGQVVSDYVKQHLVPFGEFLPLPFLFGWLRPLLGVAGDMAHSDSPGRFSLPEGVVVAPVICYEALYPSLVRNSLGAHGNILAVLSDDAWFGNTSAPYQLFRESAMRSIENGVPMLRAANTGLSGVVTPEGKIQVSGPLFKSLSLHARVDLPMEKTFYRKHGEWVLKLSLMGLLFFIASSPLRKGVTGAQGGEEPGPSGIL
jgi:apolipoprotein N-acyltransferase